VRRLITRLVTSSRAILPDEEELPTDVDAIGPHVITTHAEKRVGVGISSEPIRGVGAALIGYKKSIMGTIAMGDVINRFINIALATLGGGGDKTMSRRDNVAEKTLKANVSPNATMLSHLSFA